MGLHFGSRRLSPSDPTLLRRVPGFFEALPIGGLKQVVIASPPQHIMRHASHIPGLAGYQDPTLNWC